MANFIIKWKPNRQFKTRSELEHAIRSEGWGRSMDDEKLDKLKYLEKKHNLDMKPGDKIIRDECIDAVE